MLKNIWLHEKRRRIVPLTILFIIHYQSYPKGHCSLLVVNRYYWINSWWFVINTVELPKRLYLSVYIVEKECKGRVAEEDDNSRIFLFPLKFPFICAWQKYILGLQQIRPLTVMHKATMLSWNFRTVYVVTLICLFTVPPVRSSVIIRYQCFSLDKHSVLGKEETTTWCR